MSMPTSSTGKLLFFNSCSSDRWNKRVMGTLRGKALQKARRVVDQHGAINMSGIYGSIEIDERDFVPLRS